MKKITIFDTEVQICDSVPDEETGNAINYVINFLRSDIRDFASISVYMQGDSFDVNYTVNTMTGVEEHFKMGEDEFVFIEPRDAFSDDDDESEEESDNSAYCNNDMSEQIIEAMDNAARQTQRLADQIAWNTFWGK